jgi:uncharacterized protein (DUF4213/DUF364 family)
MGIAQKIVELMSEPAQACTIKRIQVGIIYSAVQLDNNATGVAYTFPLDNQCGLDTLSCKKPTVGSRASEIIPFLGDRKLVLSSLALAAVNALLAARELPQGATSGDVLDNLDIRNGDKVCMVGCFIPILKALQKRKIQVVSVDEQHKPGARPAEEVEYLLPDSQIAIITGTAIINNTIDRLLHLAESCREVAVLGPSTPLLREAFTATPVSCLSGIKILEPEKVLQTIGEGGGFRGFKSYVRKLNLRLSKS